MPYSPLLWPLLALIAGIIGANLTGHIAAVALVPIAFSLLAAWRKWRTVTVISAFVAVGWLTAAVHAVRPPAILPQGEVSGRVSDVSEASGGRLLTAEINGEFRANIYVTSLLPGISPGDSVKLDNVRFSPVKSSVTVPDEVDYSGVWLARRIVATATVNHTDITVTGHDTSLLQRIRELRGKALSLLLRSQINDDTGALLSAMLLADTSLLTDDLRANYSAAGMAHLLALSGLHAGIIAAIIAAMLWPLYVGRHNRSRFAVTIVMLWIFAVVTGLTPSVTRAVIMATVLMVGRILQRSSTPLNSLCFAAMLILTFSPASLSEVSFQLSFAAVVGIIVFFPAINRVDRHEHPWLYRAVSAVALPVSAILLSGAISAYYFHTFPLLFVVANVCASWLAVPLIAGGSLLILLQALGFQAVRLCEVLNFITEIINGVAEMTSAVPHAVVTGVYFSGWWFVAFSVVVLLLATAHYRRRLAPLFASLICAALTVCGMAIFAPEYPQSEHYIALHKDSTDILIRSGERCYLYTSATTSAQRDEALRRANLLYEHYLAKRRLPAIELLQAGNYLQVDGVGYAVANTPTGPKALQAWHEVDYLLVCRGFTGDVVELAQRIKPRKATVLCTSLNRRRLLRYQRELTDSAILVLTQPFIVE